MSSTTPHTETKLPSIPGLELQEEVGTGGMSVVYRAVHRNLQRTVAVKLLRATSEQPTSSLIWLRESRLMASLAHPHVVAIYDAGQVEGHSYLVMEYVAGGSLRARMSPGRPWPLAEALSLLDCIAQALDHIHRQGILHLDLKPENILYTADGEIKIADFGLSVPHADVNALPSGRAFQGTIDYCAPEYRSGLPVDARYDVFSLATLAYELLTGRLPGRVYVPASRRNPRLPPALDDRLRRGLARDPNERYASVAQFRQALAGVPRTGSPRTVRRRLGLAAAAAAIVVMALAAYRWWPAGRSAPESNVVQTPNADQPDQLVILYDKPEDLSLFAGKDGGELATSSAAVVKRIPHENPPREVPDGLPLPVWPTPGPTLVIHSPRAWGFVHPLQDSSLGQRVINHWPELLRAVVPPEKNFVKAGGFEGECLAKGHDGPFWRLGLDVQPGGKPADRDATWQIILDRPEDQPDNQALLLTNMSPDRNRNRLGCYQSLSRAPPPGAVMVLRYRARSRYGRGSLAVYTVMPVEISEDDRSPIAARIRGFAAAVPVKANDPVPNRWLYRNPTWVMPATEWQTYVVVSESPPFPTRVIHRNLAIDVAAIRPEATDQVWVDDVDLFVWRPESKP